MIVISDASTINIINDSFRSVTDNSRVILQMMASRTDDSRGVIYNRYMLYIVHASDDKVQVGLRCSSLALWIPALCPII